MNVREDNSDIEVIKQIAEYEIEMRDGNSIALYNSLVE